MNRKDTKFLFVVLLALVAAVLFRQPWNSRNVHAASNTTSEDDALRALAALHPIDAHVHIFKTAPEFQSMLEQQQLTVLNILVVDDTWGRGTSFNHKSMTPGSSCTPAMAMYFSARHLMDTSSTHLRSPKTACSRSIVT